MKCSPICFLLGHVCFFLVSYANILDEPEYMMVDTTICPDDVDYPRCGLDPVMERAECVTSSDCKTGTKCCFSGCRRRCLQPLQDKKGSCPQFKKTLCNFQTPIPYDECQTDRQCPGSSKCCSKCRKECTRV